MMPKKRFGKGCYFLVIASIIVIVTSLFSSCSQVLEDKNYGKIQGNVLYTNGIDHSGIILTLDKTDGLQAFSNEDGSRAVVAMSISDEKGSFSFFNLEPGTYTVYASSNDSVEKAIAANVVVKENETVVIEDMYLTATGSISGYVIVDGNETGNMGFLVFLGGTSFVSVTDDAGYYCLTGIPAGEDYQLVISKGNFTSKDVVSCTVPVHGMYNAGITNYSSEELDSEAGVLIWKGSLAVAPEKPKTNWAFFCTEDGCSYIYNGEDWTLLAAKGEKGDQGIQGVQGEVGETGESGANGISITWKGESSVDPTDPELYWAYYNTEDGCSYIYDGNKWTLLASKGAKGDQGSQGEVGTSGTDGVSIIWLGSFEEEPEKASEMNAYYNSTDGCSYIFDGKKWTLLASKGAKGDQGDQGLQGETGAQGEQGIQGETGASGTDGISIIWKGSHASASELVNPEKLWAYFNTSDYNSYIYNGENWELLVSRGDPYANEHTYSEEWSSDSFYHWHAATCLHPELKSDQAEHTWDEGVVTKEATHVVNGVMTYTCTVCGRKRTEIIPAGHAYEAVVTKPTTTEQGYTTYTCIRCNDSFVSDYVDPVVVPAPSFTAQPSSLNIAPNGQGISLTVETDTEEPYTVEYQWYSSTDGTIATGTIIDGETESTLSLEAYIVKGIYYYYCVVKNVLTDDDGDSWYSPETVSGIVSVAYTGLPTVVVNTANGTNPTANKEKNVGTLVVFYQDGSVFDSTEYEGEFSIKVRGNATASYPKHPYKLKLAKSMKTNLLDLSSEEDIDRDWVLLANYCDKTLLRNQIGFFASSLLNDIERNEEIYVPKSGFVDLVLNGEYLGTYTLADSVKEGQDRVPVNEKNKNAGGIGFVAEYDPNYYVREPKWFKSASKQFAYSFKFPDTDDSNFDLYMSYFEEYINAFESALYSDSDEWVDYIDIESFASWFLTHNILGNKDTNYFISKKTSDNTSKLVMGPVWDFEWSIGIGWYYGERPMDPDFWCVNGWYFEKLLEKEEFTNEVKAQWNKLKAAYPDLAGTINNKMDEYAELIMISQEINYKRWDTLNTIVVVGGIPLGSYEAELECDKQFIENRIAWLDSAINSL